MINIAIDGPAGAGKSTVAKMVAKELGFIYIDTGALYRSIGIAALRKGFSTDNREQVISILPEIELSLKFVDGEQRVILNGEDVSRDIRLPEASMAASNVSAIPEVRSFLLDMQKKFARENNCLMDGRDIGTVILPDAELKIFLTASPEVRADRRYKELIEKGTPKAYDELLEEIKVRDYNDSHRAVAPLKPAEDAVIVDTSEMSLDEVVEKIISLAKDVKK
ncbi:MAG: (d)CMP kinase [Ruminococcaceae bacterium]|nr:(d)CMP kinase [Oscillospiraceae bacterium]MBR3596826.1 (d)CMP kinase [Clostridia bacterium]